MSIQASLLTLKLLPARGSNGAISQLYPLIKEYISIGGSIINVCGEDEWLGIFHLSRMSKLGNVKSYTVPNAGHNIGAWL